MARGSRMQNQTAFSVATTLRNINILYRNARTVTRKQISSLVTMRTCQLFYTRLGFEHHTNNKDHTSLSMIG